MAEAKLSLSAFYHDSAAALIVDGEIDEARTEHKDVTAITFDDKPCLQLNNRVGFFIVS